MNVLLTGGSKGIGFAVLKKLIAEGYKCTVINRSKNLCGEILPVEIWQHDLSDITEVEEVCQKIKSASRFQVLINNAGSGVPCKFEDISVEQVTNEINLNLIAPLMLTKAALPHMEATGFGRIINISSITGKRGTPYLFSYSAAKAGLNSFTQSIAKYLNGTGVTINSICPGGVETEMSVEGRKIISRLLNCEPEYYQNNMIKQMGIGRLIRPEEIAYIILCLLKHEADFITGQSINACGAMEVI